MVKHVYTRSNTLDKKGQGTPNLTCGLADIRAWAFKQPGRKKYKLLFHNGSLKKKSIKVWYSKSQEQWSTKNQSLPCGSYRMGG